MFHHQGLGPLIPNKDKDKEYPKPQILGQKKKELGKEKVGKGLIFFPHCRVCQCGKRPRPEIPLFYFSTLKLILAFN